MIVLLIVAWCVRTDKYMYAVGGVAIVMSGSKIVICSPVFNLH